MTDVPTMSLIVSASTLKLAKRKGVVSPEWDGTYLMKDRLHAFIRLDHQLFVNVHLATRYKTFPRWTYRIDFLKDASCKFFRTDHPLWLPIHEHTDKTFAEYHDAYEAGLRHALKMISKDGSTEMS